MARLLDAYACASLPLPEEVAGRIVDLLEPLLLLAPPPPSCACRCSCCSLALVVRGSETDDPSTTAAAAAAAAALCPGAFTGAPPAPALPLRLLVPPPRLPAAACALLTPACEAAIAGNSSCSSSEAPLPAPGAAISCIGGGSENNDKNTGAKQAAACRRAHWQCKCSIERGAHYQQKRNALVA